MREYTGALVWQTAQGRQRMEGGREEKEGRAYDTGSRAKAHTIHQEEQQ